MRALAVGVLLVLAACSEEDDGPECPDLPDTGVGQWACDTRTNHSEGAVRGSPVPKPPPEPRCKPDCSEADEQSAYDSADYHSINCVWYCLEGVYYSVTWVKDGRCYRQDSVYRSTGICD